MAMLPRTVEHELIRRAKAGDGAAVEALIRAHQPALYAFMLRTCHRPEVAEDVVQEAFVRVLKNLDRFDDRFRFSTWLFTIAKRLHVNASQKLKPTYDSETVDRQSGGETSPGSASEATETQDNARTMIEAAMEHLTETQREIVVLFHQMEWSVTDIAEHLVMPEGTVKSHLHRARKRMRVVIETNATFQRHAEEVWS